MATKLAEISLPSLQLETRYVEKPWGRTDLPLGFGCRHGRRIGEIWFEHDAAQNLPLLVKYLFTSESLSVQVHPDERHAFSRGLRRGKSESWFILSADPGAKIGLGLRQRLSSDEIRDAAHAGSITELVDWRPVEAGDFVLVPAGTIHAIGAGISLLEVQQNLNVAYRLFDYGRPRELHVDEAVAVSRPDFEGHFRPAGGPVNCVLADTPHFSLVRAASTSALPRTYAGRRRWVIPIEGSAMADGLSVTPGGCLLAEAGAHLSMSPSAVVLVAVEGRI